ncbi:MAG: ribonucleoside-diphosphate reductase beta chain [Cognaticolwellia sp.]|jgi:ribonucleoside-diphosphate reductase beta chain
MSYTTFNQTANNALLEPMFLGNSVNVARYDQQRYMAFEKLIEKQLSFFWRPEEIDVSKDRADWQSLTDSEKHIFISNLKYQTLLDSMAARSVNAVLLPLVSLPEVETWVETIYGQEPTTTKLHGWVKRPVIAINKAVNEATRLSIVLLKNMFLSTLSLQNNFSVDSSFSYSQNLRGV